MKTRPQLDHTKLLCDVSELSGLFTHSTSLETFLQHTVEMIAGHMKSDVCSIYLYYENEGELILKATTGLNPDFINKIRLKLGEGLTGLALKELRPVCERNAGNNRNFRYFPGLGEEKYESFLVVPITRGKHRIGALVIQNTEKNYFLDEDIVALKAISSQLANTIEMARMLLVLEENKNIKQSPAALPKDLNFIKGKSASPGYASGEVSIFHNEKNLKLYFSDNIKRKYTLEDFFNAFKLSEQQLENYQGQIEEKLADVASLIFTAQILMLKDQAFIQSMVDLINAGINPPDAIIDVVNEYIQKFENIPNPYLQEKSYDIRDIGKRFLGNLTGEELQIQNLVSKIVVARDLLPSDALKLSSQKVKGVILLSGGVTSHVSILMRSLQIPLVIADIAELWSLPEGTRIILDADQGTIYINPNSDIIKSFQSREDQSEAFAKLQREVKAETFTSDGIRISLMANINLLGDLKNARDFKMDGVGLYRTEFPFIVRNNFPSEEEQYVIYKKLIEGMPDKEITFRTLDIGGDKVLSYFEEHSKEKNPYLGMRSIRFSLKHPEIFTQQVRAILRAGEKANIRIMFPMISSLDEFLEAKSLVDDCMNQLKAEGIPHHENPKIGIMIELPSVLAVIEDLAKEVDFFSIGTNDFIQYMLAVDRTNEKVANLYLPHHPSVLRALKIVADAGLKFKKDISICGDMAHEVKYLAFFLGIGIRKFSMDPVYLPKIQVAIHSLSFCQSENLANEILTKNRISEISPFFHKVD